MTTFFFLCTILSFSTSFGAITVELPSNGDSDASNLVTGIQCPGGWCPLSNATCCNWQTLICCPQGTFCLDEFALCLTIRPNEGKAVPPVIYTEKPTSLIQHTNCPTFMTVCYGGCCPFYLGVCCEDRQHCCPYGTTCNPPFCDEHASARFLNAIFQRPSTEKHSKFVAKSALPQTAVINSERTGAQTSAHDASNLNTETACASGWCPHANAICCNETQTCCREGTTCLGPLKLCIGLQLDEQNNGSVAVYSEKATDLRQNSGCTPFQTPCYGGCCPLFQAVCCPSKVTCCPNGYKCAGPKCLEDEDASPSTRFLSRIFQRPSIPNPFNSVPDSTLPPNRAVNSEMNISPTRSSWTASLIKALDNVSAIYISFPGDCCAIWYPPFFTCCFEPLHCTWTGCITP